MRLAVVDSVLPGDLNWRLQFSSFSSQCWCNVQHMCDDVDGRRVSMHARNLRQTPLATAWLACLLLWELTSAESVSCRPGLL